MTKVRPALSPHRALTAVAALIGWDGAAAIVGRADRTVRNWSDPDTAQFVTLEQSLQLDLAFVAAEPGAAPPFLAWYQLQLDLAAADTVAAATGRIERCAIAAEEAGEAIAAQIRAAKPGAGTAEQLIAARETEEAITAFADTLHDMRAAVARPAAGDA